MNDEVKVLDMTHADEVIREVDGGVAPTMQSRMGTGGNQVPLVMEPNAVAVCVGVKYLQSAKSQAPYSKDIAQALSAGAHDAAVAFPINSMVIGKEAKDGDRQTTGIGGENDPCPTLQAGHHHAAAIGFKAGQSANGGLGEEAEVSPTMSHQPSALEPTVAIGVSFDGRKDAPVITECAHTECVGTNPGFKNGVATMLKVRCGKDTYTKPDGSTGTAGKGPLASEESAFTLAATQDQSLVLRHIVRRLTPTECERLQAFPDGWTRIPYRGKPAEECPDSPRYKALGNSWATNCAEWILRRIVAAVRLGLIPEEEPCQ